MRLIVLLSCIAVTTVSKADIVEAPDDDKCNGIKINGIYHDKEILKTDLDRPYLLATDNSTNTVYFSYTISGEDDVFKTARYDLDNKEFSNIDEVVNGFAQAVDRKTHEVYIGGSDGIYKYNKLAKQAEFIGEKGVNIWTLFSKDVLYYTDFPSQFLYANVDGVRVRYKDLEDTKVDQFVIDDEDYIFYTNATGLYGLQKGTKDSELYMEFPETGVRGMSIDNDGKVYVCLQDGIYAADKKLHSLDKVVDVDDAFGVTFDNRNNIVYGDAQSLNRLVPIDC